MSSLQNIEFLSNLNSLPQNLEAEQTILGSILIYASIRKLVITCITLN